MIFRSGNRCRSRRRMSGNDTSPLNTPFQSSPTVLPSSESRRLALPAALTTSSPSGLTTPCFSMRAPMPCSLHGEQRTAQRGAIDLLAADIDGSDAAGVPDVFQRIGIEHEKVCAPVLSQGAGIGYAEILRRTTGRCDDDVHRRHAGGHHEFQFLLLGVAEEVVRETGVATEDDPCPGGIEPGETALEYRVTL